MFCRLIVILVMVGMMLWVCLRFCSLCMIVLLFCGSCSWLFVCRVLVDNVLVMIVFVLCIVNDWLIYSCIGVVRFGVGSERISCSRVVRSLLRFLLVWVLMFIVLMLVSLVVVRCYCVLGCACGLVVVRFCRILRVVAC